MALTPCNSRADEQGRELVQHGTLLFPVACYDDDLTKELVPWHWHDEIEAIYITDGEVVVAAAGEQYTLVPGDGCIINSDVMHSCWGSGTGAAVLHSVVFHPRLVGGGAESVFWQNYVQPVIGNRAFQIALLRHDDAEDRVAVRNIEDAWEACRDEPAGYEFLTREAMSKLIFLLQSHIAPEPVAASDRDLRNEARLKEMLEYIRRNLDGPITVRDIAGAAAVSESECLRCFKAGIHTTPMQYVNQLRLIRAAELLRTSALRVNEVAAACGFHEMSYFTRAFRGEYGVSPTEYRNQA